MERSIRAPRLTAIAGLGLTLTIFLLGVTRDRDPAQVFAAALHDARARAVRSGQPHDLAISSAGSDAILEIRAENRVLSHRSIPDTAIQTAPAWIRLGPTGHATFPPTCIRRHFEDAFSKSVPEIPGDVVFSVPSTSAHYAIRLNAATGRVDRIQRYSAELGLLARLRATLSP